MYAPPSPQFLPALAHSHTPITEVLLFRTDGRVEPLAHTGGEVGVDRGQDVRRTCTVTLDDPALIPVTATDKLTTYGARLRISRGIAYADGHTEFVPLGNFRVDEIDGDVDTGPVTVTGSGPESYVIDDRFRAPWKHTSLTTAVAGIRALIQDTLPDAVVVNLATDATVGSRTWDQEGDRWAAVKELATAIGAEVYCDADGVFIIAELPDMATAPAVWDIAAGEGGAYIKASRGMSRRDVYNSVTAFGENTEDDVAPVSATVEDIDPTSPTYINGPFGRVPRFYNSPLLVTTNLCTQAANKILRDAVKPNASANITALPNPCLEPGDIIRAVYGDGRAELHQVHSFSIPLSTDGDVVLTTISSREDE